MSTLRNTGPDEETALLPRLNDAQMKTSQTSMSRWRRHLMVDVTRDWTDLVLILCYFITGLLDSASISVWGSFVSMQTGNTVYIGLGLANPRGSTRWIKSGVSLLSFSIGSFLFSRFHRFFSPQRRWVLAASFAAQFALTAAAAALLTASASVHHGLLHPSQDDTTERIAWDVLAPIALVAFQSCGQAVASRVLRHTALNSVVLTSLYCDLFSDPGLLALRNPDRNRRAAAPLALLLGACAGGWLVHSPLGVAAALWAASAVKALVVVMWLVWPAHEGGGTGELSLE